MVTLAHQGGWDEILMVAIPLALVAVLLIVANRRATQAQSRQEDAVSPSRGPRRQP